MRERRINSHYDALSTDKLQPLSKFPAPKARNISSDKGAEYVSQAQVSSAKGAEYVSQGQALSEAKRVAPGFQTKAR
jgi:TolB-like protein